MQQYLISKLHGGAFAIRIQTTINDNEPNQIENNGIYIAMEMPSKYLEISVHKTLLLFKAEIGLKIYY